MARKEKLAKKPTEKELEEVKETSKTDVVGYVGGLNVDLTREIETTGGWVDLRAQLTHDVDTWLTQEIKNQAPLIENIAKWQKMYRGQRPSRNFPYPSCANLAVPLMRINTEAIAVRIIDGFWSQPRFWTVKPVKKMDRAPEEVEMWDKIARAIEEDMDWWQKSIVDLKRKMFSPLMQAIKTGTGIIKMCYESKKRTVVRYATADEIKNKVDGLFKFENGQDGIKEVITEYEGPNVYSISREDFVISSDADSIQTAFLVGWKQYLRKSEMLQRARQGLHDTIETEKLMHHDQLDETKISRAEEQGKEIPPESQDKFEIWELWLKYDVDNDGEEDDIVVTYHPGTKSILRCIYNPMFNNFRPFIDLVFNPSEYCFEGEGTCEILEQLQVEIDALHNQRLDRLTQINAPMLFVKRGLGIDNLKLLPGLVTPIDDNPNESIYEFRFSDTTYSTINEEGMLNDYANKATGVTPDILGQPSVDRPVFKETVSRVQEANKKFKFGIDNLRKKGADIGQMYIEMTAQYQPVHRYKTKQGGEVIEKTVVYPFEYLRDGINIELMASSEVMNQEVRREQAMARYQIISQHHTGLAGMMQAFASPYTPIELKKLILKSSQIGEKEMERVLQDMDALNPEESVMSIDDLLTPEELNKAMQMSGMQPPPEQGGGQRGQGGAPGGRPGGVSGQGG